MNMTVISINAQLAAADVKEAVGLENKIKAAMKAVIRENWMDTNDDSMMRAALAAVLLDVGQDSDDGKRLVKEIDLLKRMNALLTMNQQGIPMTLETAFSGIDLDEVNKEPRLALLHMWKEAKA